MASPAYSTASRRCGVSTVAVVNRDRRALSTPSVIYGQLRESLHVSGYTESRDCDALEWIIEEYRWRHVGSFADGHEFLATIDLSEFRIDETRRKNLVRRLSEVTNAPQRAIAQAVGVGVGTINRDLNVPNGTKPQKNIELEQEY